jgi:hypothetical protein
MRVPRLVLYPLFAAVYPVLALAAGNPGEVPGLWVLTWPVVISLCVALGAWLLLSVFLRDPDRRAFVTLMVVLVFAWYGYFTIGLSGIPWAAPYASTALPLLFIVAYLAGATYVVFRLVPNLRALTRFLTIFTAILVAWTTIDLLRQTAQVDWSGYRVEPATTSANATGKTGPDIYLIVLDKYTGSRSLRDNFGFDNADFESFLVERGFVLPRKPQANYIYTPLSLAALLNYRYLDDLPADPEAETRTTAYVNHLVEDNAVWRFLQARHYRFIFFPTGFRVTWSNRFADLQVPDPRRMLTEFGIVWRETTLAAPVLSWVCRQINCPDAAKPLIAYGKFLNWKFDQLSQVPRWPREGRPLFVFAHIPIPHEPYVFLADCSIRPPFWRSVEDETPEKQAYVEQITCLNRRLKSVVKRILRDSPTPPVILLQSDHGHGRMLTPYPDVDHVSPDRVTERADVFAAYYLPGADGGIIYDSITPVNVFRAVFREYFQADLPPLPDKTYWSSGAQLFKFTRVNRGHRWQDAPP